MKKLGNFIRNFYRITVASPRSDNFYREVRREDNDCLDSQIRNAIANDPVNIEPDSDLLDILTDRVANKKKSIKENSFFFIPFFPMKNLEMKMGLISLIIVISLGINPRERYQTERKLSPFSLADTLVDSSNFERPIYYWTNEKN